MSLTVRWKAVKKDTWDWPLAPPHTHTIKDACTLYIHGREEKEGRREGKRK